LQARTTVYEQDLVALRGERAKLQAEAKAERVEWGAQIRALEDRAAREIDRARQELKAIKTEAAAAAKASLRREQTMRQALNKAERTIAEQARRRSTASTTNGRASRKSPASQGRTGATRSKPGKLS